MTEEEQVGDATVIWMKTSDNKMRLIKVRRVECGRTGLPFKCGKRPARRLIEMAEVRGSRGPRAELNLHLCVRRSGVLGVEMKTLPVKTSPPIEVLAAETEPRRDLQR